MKSCIIFFLSFALYVQPASAKNRPLAIPQIIDSGTTITAIASNENFIWVGTDQGLYRIVITRNNKHKLKHFTITNSILPDNYITSVCCSNDGKVWIGTNKGLVFYNGFVYTLITKENSGLPDNRISSIALDEQKNLWIGTMFNGLVKTDGESYKVYNTFNSNIGDNNIYSVSIDKSGAVWVGIYLKGLVKFYRNTWTHFNAGENGLNATNITFVKQNENGTYFLASYDDGMFEFDGQTFSELHCTLSNARNIYSIYQSLSKGKIILCCKEGLFIGCAFTFKLDKMLADNSDRFTGIEPYCVPDQLNRLHP